MWETLRDIHRRQLKKLHSGQAAGTKRVPKWKYFTTMSFVNSVMIPRPTLSDVPETEKTFLGSTRILESGNASTNVLIGGNDKDKFSEGVSDERQVKKNLGTKRQIRFQEEGKRKMEFMEEMLMKKSKSDKDEDFMFLMSLLPSIKKLEDIQRLELRIEFLSCVSRRIQISKNLSQPFHTVPTASSSSCIPSPSSLAERLD